MKIKIIILFTSLSFTIQAQVNHVLNYSLEQDSNCNLIQMCGPVSTATVKHWYDPSAGYANWFSPCFGNGSNNYVPQNFSGYQNARTGQCYGAICPIGARNAVAYITGTLSDSLKTNKKYCVTFFVSLADSEWWATNSIGAYFSNDSICVGNTYNILPYTPQIENPASNFITNKIDWVPVSGEFRANGGEIFITLGGFQNTTPSNTDSVGHGGVIGFNSELQTAYYVDDVYVRELTIAVAGKTDTICVQKDSVLIGKDSTTPGVSFHWLPMAGLNNPNIAQPVASPSVTTIYTLTVINDSVLAINNRGQACNCADSVTKDSVKIVVNRCGLGIDEVKNNENIKILPNPSSGAFDITGLTDGMIIEVYDYTGRLVNYLTAKNTSIQVNISDKSDGVYLIRLMTKNMEFVGQRKVIKSE